jgi:hypothetical protein
MGDFLPNESGPGAYLVVDVLLSGVVVRHYVTANRRLYRRTPGSIPWPIRVVLLTTLREDYRLRAFENRVLRRMFESKRRG